MTNSRDPDSFASQLLKEDESMHGQAYQGYRQKLEQALVIARRREKLTYWIGLTSGLIWFAMVLTIMFFGEKIGDLDPSSDDANIWSVTISVAHTLAVVVFFLSLASYYSRFRPRTRQSREDFRDWQLAQLESRVAVLTKQVGLLRRETQGDAETTANEEPPNS